MLLLASMSLILLPLSSYGAVAFPTRAPIESSSSAQCTVLAGVPGVPGVPGSTGVQGSTGVPGSTGNNGLPGQPGIQGATGPSGPAGEPGELGASIAGPRGPPGERGPAGIIGPAGPRSAPGKIGPQGPMGPTGERGPMGLKGEAGPVGSSGDSAGSGVKGQKGDAGQTRHSSFTVVRKTEQTISAEDVLTYDEVITNIGGDFNLHEGKFICEIAGVYIFSFSIMVNNNQGGVSLVKNGEISVGAYARDKGAHNNIEHSSATAVLQLQSDDQVWLRAITSGVIYSDEWKFTSFTGYLLHEL